MDQRSLLHLQVPRFLEAEPIAFEGGVEAEVVVRAQPFQVVPIKPPLQGLLLGLYKGCSKRKRAHDSLLCQVFKGKRRSP